MSMAAFMLLCMGCENWVAIGSFTIIQADYTGPNTARVTYNARDFCTASLYGDVCLYNKNDTEQYRIKKEGDHKYISHHKYSVDITVSPEWEPGDHVTVRGEGVYGGVAEFDVP
jgi:hypothetical protein